MSNQNQLAIIKKDVVDIVTAKVRQFQSSGELHLPANYSPENAMKSAFLILQNTKDKDKRPVLDVCAKDSIANSLLDMVVQGLNPAKKQCYFIAYGKILTCQRSYFGTMAVAKSLCGAKDIFSQVVWGGDVFEYEINRGNKSVTTHKQKLENVGKSPVAGYCIIVFDDGREYTDIMTMDQIKKAWSKSKMNPSKDGSTHKEFAEEMIRKTVIGRACKRYINASSDSAILVERFNRADDISAEIEFQEDLSDNANAEVIDIEPGALVDAELEEDGCGLTEEEKQEILAQEAAEAEAESKDDVPY